MRECFGFCACVVSGSLSFCSSLCLFMASQTHARDSCYAQPPCRPHKPGAGFTHTSQIGVTVSGVECEDLWELSQQNFSLLIAVWKVIDRCICVFGAWSEVQLCLESSIKTVFLLSLIKMTLNQFKSLFFQWEGGTLRDTITTLLPCATIWNLMKHWLFFYWKYFPLTLLPISLCSFFLVFLSSLLHVRLSLQTINPPACSFNLHITLPLTIINKIATHT